MFNCRPTFAAKINREMLLGAEQVKSPSEQKDATLPFSLPKPPAVPGSTPSPGVAEVPF